MGSAPASDPTLWSCIQKFDTTTLASSDGVEDFASRLLSINQEITQISPAFAFKDWQLSLRFINNLSPAYQDFVDSLLTNHSITGVRGTKSLTFHEFVQKVVGQEQVIKERDRRNRAALGRESTGRHRVQDLRRSFQ